MRISPILAIAAGMTSTVFAARGSGDVLYERDLAALVDREPGLLRRSEIFGHVRAFPLIIAALLAIGRSLSQRC